MSGALGSGRVAQIVRSFFCFSLVLLCSGCIGQGQWGKNPHASFWPSGQTLREAAVTAATSRQTWIPLAGAALLQIDDVDDRWSEDLATDRPLFGDDAEDISDDLRDVATGAYVLTALFADSETFGDKGRGLAVGAATMVLDGIATQSLKDLGKRAAG